MPLGPMIDPPYPQSDHRPCGVYRRPDERAGMQGRIIYEIWNEHGDCLACVSLLGRAADASTEVTMWSWLDDRIDRRRAVNGPETLPPPPRVVRHLRSI